MSSLPFHEGKITKWNFSPETGGHGEIMPTKGDRIDYNGSYLVFSASAFPVEQRTSLMINRRVSYRFSRETHSNELRVTEAKLR